MRGTETGVPIGFYAFLNVITEEISYPAGTRVLLWRLEQELPEMLALCRQAGIAVDDIVDLRVKRQREKAAERLLLCRAFGHPVTLDHTSQGAPLVLGHEDVNISITHTTGLVALAVNESCLIGIDAEQADRRQVLKVRDKFLNASEQRFIAHDDLTAHIIAWTAKEAVIKAERNSALDWTDGIVLAPSDNACENGQATLVARCGDNSYRLTSRIIDGHWLTVATTA